MILAEIELPSNKKFGILFTCMFAFAATYFYYTESISLAYSIAAASVFFCIITLLKPDILLPLNILWMRIGVLLGVLVSPIVLGIIFFGVFTPIAIIMRLSGRDELRLKFNKKPSHWILRREPIKSVSFKLQF